MATIDRTAEFRTQVERVINAPRERVFTAWTSPAEVAKWWGYETMTAKKIDIDLRVGGGYRYTLRSDEGNDFVFGGKFLEVSAPERLVHTWMWIKGPYENVEMRVTVEFLAEGKKTRVRVTHEELPDQPAADVHNQGWSRQLDSLVRHFQGEPT